mgnify:CR=1 FL=1
MLAGLCDGLALAKGARQMTTKHNPQSDMGRFWRPGWDRYRPMPGGSKMPNLPPWPLANSQHPADIRLTRLHELTGGSEGLYWLAQRQAVRRDAQLTPAARAFMSTTPGPGELNADPSDQIFGTLPDGQPFRVKPVGLLASLLLIGPPRTGKTTVLALLTLMATAIGVLTILFDQKLTLYPLMERLLGRSRVARLAMDQLPLNLIQPHGRTPLSTSINDTVELLATASRRYRAIECLHDVIADVMPTLPPDDYPDLDLLIAGTRRLYMTSKGRDRDLVLGLQQSLDQLQRTSPDVFKYRWTNTLETLTAPMGRPIVLEDHGLPDWVYLLILGIFLRRMYTDRKAVGAEHVTHPIVLATDDGTEHLDKVYDKESPSNASPISATLKVCPEFQLAFWAVVHNLVSISDKVISHSRNIIVTGVDGRDLSILAQLLGLNREQLDALRVLRKDECVAYMPDTYPKPVYLRITPSWLPPIQ